MPPAAADAMVPSMPAALGAGGGAPAAQGGGAAGGGEGGGRARAVPAMTPVAVRLALERALAEGSVAALRAVWADAVRREHSGIAGAACLAGGAAAGVHQPLAPGTLVRCAEVALALSERAVAAEALASYRRLVSASDAHGCDDQFAPRAHYASALVNHGDLVDASLKGQALVDGTLSALSQIIAGVRAASRSASRRHGFLVYNGSVHYWHVSRELQRDGVRPLLLPTLEPLVSALAGIAADVPGLDAWRARYLTLLSRCIADSGGAKADEAAKHASEAVELAAKAAAAPEQQLGDDGGGTDGGALEAARALKAHLNPAKAAADGSKEQQAIARLQAVRSKGSAVDSAAAEAELRAIWREVDSAGAEAAESATGGKGSDGSSSKTTAASAGPQEADGIGMRVVAEVAWVAASRGLVELALSGAARAAQATTLLPRSKGEMARVAALLWRAATDPPVKLTASTVRTHTDALRRLDSTLASLLRLRDVRVISECCQLIWTAALPLLQSNLRARAQRPLASAARALDAVSSPLHELRAKLHLELALCDVAEDMLSTAQVHCQKGLALDYVCDAGEKERTGLDRPWDAYLVPLAKRLKLRSDIYHQPEGAHEQALLLIERVRDEGGKGKGINARGVALRSSLLERAIELLESARPLPPSSEEDAPKRVLFDELGIWCEVMKAAWGIGLAALVRRAALRVLDGAWAPQGGWDATVDREAVRMQADACFIDAEASAQLARAASGRLLAPGAVRRAARRGGAEVAPPEHARVATSLVLGMRKGLALMDAVIVQNAAVYAWNYFLPVLDRLEFADLLPLLDDLFDGLMEISTVVGGEVLDGVLVCCVAQALARAHEHAHFAEAAEATARGDDAEIEWDDADTLKCVNAPAPYKDLLAKASATKQTSKRLARAKEVCKAALPLSKGQLKRELVATLARVVSWAGGDAAGESLQSGGREGSEDEDSESRAVALIESLSMLPPEGESKEDTQKRKHGTVAAAIKALADSTSASTDVELWARLAAGALNAGDYNRAIECGERAAALAPAPAALFAAAAPPQPGTRPWTDSSEAPAQGRCAYWLSVAEGVCGRALVALISPAVQARTAQDALRNRALERLARACAHGAASGRRDLVTYAARQLWNAALPFAQSKATHCVLTPYLERCTAHLASLASEGGHISDTDPDLPLYIRLYSLLFECLASEKRWSDGAKYADEAFRNLPSSAHKALWEHRIAFMTRLGVDAMSSLGQLHYYEESLQARLWLTLAQASPKRTVQLSAYQKAIECLKEKVWLRVDYMVDYAEWLYLTGLPHADAEDVLLSAADLIIDLEGEGDEYGSNRLMKMTRNARTGSLASSPRLRRSRSQVSILASLENVETPRSLAHSFDDSTNVPGPHPWQQSRFGATTPHSRGPSRAPSRLQIGGNGESPVGDSGNAAMGSGWSQGGSPRRASRLGGPHRRMSVPSIQRPQQLNALHYRLLVRVMVTLAVVTTDTKSRTDFVLLAHHYCVGMLTKCLEEVADAMATSEEEAAFAAKPKAGATPGMSELVVPTTPEAWPRFKLPAAAREALLSSTSDAVISAQSLDRPELLLANLEALWTMLCDMGLHLHSVPVAHAAMLVADAAMKSDHAAVVWRLRLAEQQLELDLAELALETEADALTKTEREVHSLLPAEDSTLPTHAVCDASRAVPLSVTADERIVGRDEVRARLAIKDMTNGGRATPFDADRFGRPTPTSDPREVRIDAAKGTMVIQPPSPREAFLARARFLLRRGALREARENLLECLENARAFDDHATVAWCECHLGELELLKGDARAAVRHLEAALAGGGDTFFWRKAAVAYAEACAAIGQHALGVEALREAAAAAERLAEEQPYAEHAARRAAAELAFECARMLVSAALGDAADQRPGRRLITAKGKGFAEHGATRPVTAEKRALSKLAAGVDMLSAAADAFASLGGGPPLVECQLELAKTIGAGAPLLAGDHRKARTQLLRRRDVLLAAATEAASVVAAAKPSREVGGLSLPAERLLARVEAALADVHMELSEASQAAEAADLEAARPAFPFVSGAEEHIGEVRRFLDECIKATSAPPQVLSSDEAAITHAANARALGRGEAAAARCNSKLGMALLRTAAEMRAKFGCAEDGEAGAWPDLEAEPTEEQMGEENEFGTDGEDDQGVDEAAAKARGAAAIAVEGDAQQSDSSQSPARGLWKKSKVLIDAGHQFLLGSKRAMGAATASQAVALLDDACEQALRAREYSVAGPAALRLCAASGKRDAAAAAGWLAMAQGVVARADALALYVTAATPTDNEAMAMRLHEHCVASMPRPESSALAARFATRLSQSKSTWAVMDIHTRPLAALSDAKLPADVRVLILHAPSGEGMLYMAHLSPAKAKQGAEDDDAAEHGFEATVARAPLDEAALASLSADYDKWLERCERSMTASMRRALVVENVQAGAAVGVGAHQGTPDSQADQDGGQEPAEGSGPCTPVDASANADVGVVGGRGADGSIDELQDDRGTSARPRVLADATLDAEWLSLLARTEALLGEQVVRALERAARTADATARAPDADADSEVLSSYVLIADSMLSALPLDAALGVLRQRAVSRDLSVYSLARRAGDGESQAAFDSARGTYVFDPRGQDTASWAAAPGRAAPPAREALAAAGALEHWSGLTGSEESTPSRGELQRALRDTAGAFTFYGTGPFLSHLPPASVAALDLSSLGLAVLLDRSSNDDAMREQMYLNSRKESDMLALEGPHASASLLLARGARCVVLPRAAWPADAQHAALRDLLPALIDPSGGDRGGVARAVRAAEAASRAAAPARFLERHMLVYGLPHAASA